MSDKTEDPTPRKLERARREGDVPVSQALLQAVALAIAAALAPSAIRALSHGFDEMLRGVLAAPDAVPSPIDALREAISLSAPLLVAVACGVGLVGIVQTRALFAPARIAPDLTRLSPASLFKAIASPQRAFAVLRALLTASVVGYLVVSRLSKHLPDLAHASGRIDRASLVSASIAGGVVRDAVLVVLALSIVDLLITRRSWLSRLRMSRQEVQREHKESEGDPNLKAARERAHLEMLASATVAAVKDATVVIVNPTHLANALRYLQDGDEAPVLVAKGEGELARRIVEAAHAYGIPVVRDVSVAQALSTLQDGDAIPASLYEAVALILQELEGE